MRQRIERKGVLALLLCLTLSVWAQGAPITIAIEATIDQVSDLFGHLEGKISSGGFISGFYIYESTTPDSNPSDPKVGNYWHDQVPYGVFLVSNGFEFATDVNFMMEIVNDNSGIDAYSFESDNNKLLSNGVAVTEISWRLYDYTLMALGSDALPTTAPVLSAWDENRLYIEGGPRETRFVLDATVTHVEVVPEPSTIVLLATAILLFRAFSG